jgi:hypothetical protein
LTDPHPKQIISMTRRDDASGGRLQIGMLAGFASEHPAGFELECMAGFIGTRIPVWQQSDMAIATA